VILEEDQSDEMDLTKLAVGADKIDTLVRVMPEETVFVVFNCYGHGHSFDINHLATDRSRLGFKKHAIFHQGQEQPWSDPLTNPADHCYAKSAERLGDIYNHYDLVLRQYYYQPYEHKAQYIPLGAPHYGHLIPMPPQAIKPASQRSISCFFAGRFEYPSTGIHEVERKEIAQLIFNDEFPCSTSASFGNHKYLYYQYLDIMKDTQFAPCPAGGSAETYRLFEALETGAIPVLVRQSSDRDFLSQWEGYPGPVLDSWSELKAYLQSMGVRASVHIVEGELVSEREKQEEEISGADEDLKTVSAASSFAGRVDQLQKLLQIWYADFKRKTKERVAISIEKLFFNSSSGS
jgi:hypothetical protein